MYFYLVPSGRASCSGNVMPDVYAAKKQEGNKFKPKNLRQEKNVMMLV